MCKIHIFFYICTYTLAMLMLIIYRINADRKEVVRDANFLTSLTLSNFVTANASFIINILNIRTIVIRTIIAKPPPLYSLFSFEYWQQRARHQKKVQPQWLSNHLNVVGWQWFLTFDDNLNENVKVYVLVHHCHLMNVNENKCVTNSL